MSAAPLAARTASLPQLVGPGDFGGVFADELHDQVNLDYAATTPALRAAAEAVLRVLPAYGSVHRGGGARSRITTEIYEQARASVERFVGAGDEHVVVFVRNTTEAINLAAASLPRGSRVLCSPLEHHANLLPWRDHEVDHLPFTSSAGELVEAAISLLDRATRAGRPFDLVAVCGASNVTGEVLPVARLATAAHAAGARVLVDAAQLAPHHGVDVTELGADYLALSGHKLYAPFGCGALVVRREAIESAAPLLKGGGAVRVVTLDDVAWASVPHRLEAGTPNVLGAVALAAACDALARHGLRTLEEHEHALARRLWSGLAAIRGCRVLRAWPTGPRVAVASFVLDGLDAREVGERLARDHGIAVRTGLFCAHPFVAHLLGTTAEAGALVRRAAGGEDVVLTGAVRASIGIGVEPEHVDRLLAGLAVLAPRPPRPRPAAVSPRVDVHRHLWPDALVEALRARRDTPPYLDGSTLVTVEGAFEVDVTAHGVDACLADLDRHDLDVAIVSLQPTLGIDALPADEAAALFEAFDRGIERAIVHAAGRLRAFAAGGARVGFAGLCVPAAALRDLDRLAPELDALAEHGQTLFVHPGPAAPAEGRPAWWAPAVDYTAQMQAAYAAWLAEGTARWPGLPVLFAILAGGAPFQLERLRSRGVDTRRAAAANVYLDTASYGRLSLELCLAAYGVERLVHGSDAPVIDAAPTLSAVNALGKATADAICRHNPAALLDRPALLAA